MSYSSLVFIHVLLGFVGCFVPILLIIEVKKSLQNISRKKLQSISLISLITIFISWVTGGIYYVQIYGSQIKKVILQNHPIVHNFFMESKEHLFLFIPPLILTLLVLSFSEINEFSLKIIKKISYYIIFLGLFMVIAGIFIYLAQRI